MSKKKLFTVIAVVIYVVAVILGAVAFSSKDNIANIQENYVSREFKADELVFDSWLKTEKGYTSSSDDPTLLMNNVDCYVHNLLFSGSIDSFEKDEVKFYYTTEKGETFSEEKAFTLYANVIGGNAYFTLDRYVYDLRVDLYDISGKEAEIFGFTANPRIPNVSLTLVLGAFTVLFLLPVLVVGLLAYRKSLKDFVSIFQKYRYLLSDLIVRDLKVKYRRSVLGFIWSILNPLLMMLVITAVFSNIFKFDIKDFPIYYLTGSLIFNFVSEATSSSLTSVIGAGPLIKKVYIPKYIFPLEKCLFAFVNMLFSLVAVAIVYAILQIELHWTILMFPIPMIYAFVFSVGLSLILSAANVFFRDIGHLYSVWITAWMYLTPIIYPLDVLPDAMISVVKLNPLFYYVEYLRDVMIYGTVPGLKDNLICIGFAVTFLMMGLLMFKKKQDKFILYI